MHLPAVIPANALARIKGASPLRSLRRRTVVIGVSVLTAALVIASATVWSSLGSDTSSADGLPTPSASATVIATAPAAPVPGGITPEGLAPGSVIATTSVENLNVYSEAGGSSVIETLGEWSPYSSPRTLMASDVATIDGVEWYEVTLPVQPNGTIGWIRASDVTLSSTDLEIHVYLDERSLELREGDAVLIETSVVIGAPETPTPVGIFYLTDPLDLTANPTGVYGAYALGLSGFSEVLTSFSGGPPQIAIHGTNNPGLMGQARSNGCIRVPNDIVLQLAGAIELGTPVIIHETRL